MPDISMCQDRTCPKRATCERHPDSGTVPGRWQWWLLPLRRGNDCDDYIPKPEATS